jgi:flagellar assembly protein FliH
MHPVPILAVLAALAGATAATAQALPPMPPVEASDRILIVSPHPDDESLCCGGLIAEARRAGVQEGYQNGYRDGLVALESFKQTFAAQTTAQVGALLTRLDAEFDALQPRLAAAVDLASQVLKSELKANPDVVAAVAQQALGAMLLSARHITLQLHPQDLPLVAEGAREALEARSARLVANPALARGDCIVESDVGTIDARIETLWAQATSGLEPAP